MGINRSLSLEQIYSLPTNSIRELLVSNNFNISDDFNTNYLIATILLTNAKLVNYTDTKIIGHPRFNELYLSDDIKLSIEGGRETVLETRHDLIRKIVSKDLNNFVVNSPVRISSLSPGRVHQTYMPTAF